MKTFKEFLAEAGVNYGSFDLSTPIRQRFGLKKQPMNGDKAYTIFKYKRKIT